MARVDLGGKTILQLSGQVAIDADGKVVGTDIVAARGIEIFENQDIRATIGATMDRSRPARRN